MSQPSSPSASSPPAISPEEQLWNTILENDVTTAKALLLKFPGLDINWGHPGYSTWTALHNAASSGLSEFTRLFLSHPDINVNVLDSDGKSAFYLTCAITQVTTLPLLLADARVDINRPDPYGATPLWQAAFRGDVTVVRMLIASGRRFDLAVKTVRSPVAHAELARLTALEAAKRNGQAGTAALLEKYRPNPDRFAEVVRRDNNIAPIELMNPGRLSKGGYRALLQGQMIPDDCWELKPCG